MNRARYPSIIQAGAVTTVSQHPTELCVVAWGAARADVAWISGERGTIVSLERFMGLGRRLSLGDSV